MNFTHHFLTFFRIGDVAIVTYPRACSTKTKNTFRERPSLHHLDRSYVGVRHVRELEHLAGCKKIILLVRNHYERVLSNYYGFIVGGPDTAGGNDTPEMEKIYGSRGSFEDFVNNLESLMNRDILSNASEHYAPYTKLHDIAGIPISFLMDNFLVSTWSTRRYSELFDYLGQNGLKFDKNKLAIRAVGIVPTVYADPRVVVQHSYRDDPHLIDFLEWRGIEEKYPYQLMYTPKMISKIKAYYHCDTALDAKLCEFRSELSGFN